MTPEEFKAWLAEMKAGPHPRAKSDAECARLLGITPMGLRNYKRRGSDRRTALACKNLLHRFGAYGE